LRALTPADVDDLFALFSDPAVMRYWSRPPMTERAEAQALLEDAIAAFEQGESFRWGLEANEDGRMIGTVSLFHLDAQNRRGEIGYALASDRWGRGLMHEALSEVLRYAFADGDSGGLDLIRLEADLDPRNSASRRSLERLGFQEEGLLRERWIVAGERTDSLLMGLLRRAWRQSSDAR
jgi:RimJ/RimL family protein N-acetyltransferase